MKPLPMGRERVKQTERIGISAGCALSVLLIAACMSARPPAALTPPSALIDGDPWRAAKQLSLLVPNSTVMIGQGDSMAPLYPTGTVLVLQRLDWAHLRDGMTVVFFRDLTDRFSLSGGILVRQEGRYWYTSGANSDMMSLAVQSENYLGTVVAAFRGADAPDATEFMRAVPMRQAQDCLLRCHVQ